VGKKAKKKERKKRKETQRCDKSHYLPRPPTLRYLLQSCHAGCGAGHSQPCQASSKSVQEGSKSAIFYD